MPIQKVRRVVVLHICQGKRVVQSEKFERGIEPFWVRRKARSIIRRLEKEPNSSPYCYAWEGFDKDNEFVCGQTHSFIATKWTDIERPQTKPKRRNKK